MDLVRYEILWLIGAFSVALLALEADPKVTRAAVMTFGIYAASIIIGKLSEWWNRPDPPEKISLPTVRDIQRS